MEVIDADVLIIGAGIAGMRAAIAAAEADRKLRVLVVSKTYAVRSHSVCAQGGTAAALREGDSPELHAWDTVKGSDFLADQDVVEFFTRKAPEEVIRLDHWGCPWSRTPDGKIAQRPFGGHSFPRACFAADMTGLHEVHTLYGRALAYDNIEFYEEWFVTSLVVDGGVAKGATAIELKTGDMHTFRAKAIVMATGGHGEDVRVHHILAHRNRGRDGNRLQGWSPTHGHGVPSIPPNWAGPVGHTDYGGG